MQGRFDHQFPELTAQREATNPLERELGLLRDVLRMLPVGVTVQDEEGRFLLINDTAAAQLGIDDGARSERAAKQICERQETGLELLRAGRTAIAETNVIGNGGEQVLLTAHRPVRIGERNLLLSSSADISEQKAFEDHLFRAAYFDELTGLSIQRVIEHRVQRLVKIEPFNRFALAFFDIDNFKHINDYYGYSVSNALLIEIAKRLGLDLRDSDMLSRVGGDEFMLLLNPIEDEAQVAEHIGAALHRLKAPFYIDDLEIFASTSIGVSLFPEHGHNYEVLRQNVDVAMYRAKNNGKGAVVFFDVGMEREVLGRMKIEQSLRLAILEKRFCCAFQPKVDIRTKEVKGVEALVRLRDDEGVLQAPSSFINLAVELGLIDELTHLVLAEIVRSIDLINENFGPAAMISINIAAKQANDPTFMRSFAEALEATGFPKRFMIEVTEDAFVTKTQFQSEILPIFRKMGVGISIDDFGIGYSSLSALADITADEIKIDRSFISDIHLRPRSQSILRAIESLSEALGMTVVAEGVETFEELAYLQGATRIRYAQGFYFSRPVFLEDMNLPAPAASEARFSEASRPAPGNRQAYAARPNSQRPNRYRR